jgi:chemotaxis protein CheX
MFSPSRVVDQNNLLAQSLDKAVEEVFHLMMGMRCLPVVEHPAEERQMISAMIGLAGVMSGICVLCAGETVVLRIAEMLMGTPMPTLNDLVKDAVGEVCNMIAGAWKSRLPSLASQCMLSTPTIITGTNYQLHYQRPEFRIGRFYGFQSHSFAIILLCESMQ